MALPSIPVSVSDAETARRATGDGHLQAQLLGQENRRRGLKGGRPAIDQAQSAYMGTEWRGAPDRRLPCGSLRDLQL